VNGRRHTGVKLVARKRYSFVGVDIQDELEHLGIGYSERIATIGWTEVARRAAGRPARRATETAIVDART
jgi:hypothetical protein